MPLALEGVLVKTNSRSRHTNLASSSHFKSRLRTIFHRTSLLQLIDSISATAGRLIYGDHYSRLRLDCHHVKIVVEKFSANQALPVFANNNLDGDSCVGEDKSLFLAYSYGPSLPKLQVVVKGENVQIA